MKDKGITLTRLRATGDKVEPAEVQFSTGLNVIGYMTNTGKSYVLDCIDFMLGGKELPRTIKQSKEYDTLWLEIIDATKQTYVLRRPLAGGKFCLYRMALADIVDDSPWKPLATTTKAKSSAASFVMGLSGFSNAKLKQNESNAKVNLSFRTISHFFIVNEISMIDDPSPIQSRAGFAITTERSAFKFLLNGIDDSDLEEAERASTEELSDRIRREVYDEMIRQLDAELLQINGGERSGLVRIEELDRLIDATSAAIAETSARIREQMVTRRLVWLDLQTAESRAIVLNELLARFALLREHYASDLTRLEFISEGQHFLDQLETIACPLCGTPLAEHQTEFCHETDEALSIDIVQDANAREADKIRTHTTDLDGTVSVIQREHNEVTAQLAAMKSQIHEIDQRLSGELAPKISIAKEQVQELIEARGRLLHAVAVEARLAGLRAARDELGDASEEGVGEDTKGENGIHIDEQAIADFCSTMRKLLESWRFLPSKAEVTFDTAKFDFVVDGQARRNNGKGVRALIHAAFNIALMRYCIAKNLPHPRFVVLDSPLTTFKERGQSVRPDDVDEVSGEVQMAFFEDLANTSSEEQIIVLENKQPPQSIKDKFTYIQFVGYNIPGRAGFFPATKTS